MIHDPSIAPRLEARDLSASLPGPAGLVRVFEHASFTLLSGEVADVVGPSGSGKSTLLRALSRLLPDTSGELLLDGMPSSECTEFVWRTRVSLMPQRPAIVAGSVGDNLMLPWALKVRGADEPPPVDAVREALDAIGLGGTGLDHDARRLSVGQQARVALLRVLLTSPAVLLLDEVDAALDPESAAAVARSITRAAELGAAVIRVRHRESDNIATRRFVLRQGVLDEVTA